MDNKVHLRVVTRDLYVTCPYQRDKKVVASLCFMGQRTPTNSLCFRCPDGQVMEEKHRTRTFRKVVAGPETPEGPNVRFLVSVSRKRHGVPATYAMLRGGRVEMPFHETVVQGTWLTTRERHGLLPDAELDRLAAAAAKERSAAKVWVPVVKGGRKMGKKSDNRRSQMIGEEMKGLIADRRKRDGLPEKPAEKVQSRYFGEVSAPKSGKVDKPRKTKLVMPSHPLDMLDHFEGRKRKKTPAEAEPETMSSLLGGAFKGMKKKQR